MLKIIAAITSLLLASDVILPPNEASKSDRIQLDGPEFIYSLGPKFAVIVMAIQTLILICSEYSSSSNWTSIEAFSFLAIVLGYLIRKWAFLVLGKLFTYKLTIRKGHTLITTGPYRWVRHPSYSGLALVVFGVIRFLFNPNHFSRFPLIQYLINISNWTQTLLFPMIVIYRISGEERMLEDQFKAEWLAYKSRTWRLIPYVF
jgi:protein-S-isoprenylcysteine O-methyltransferase Ste14